MDLLANNIMKLLLPFTYPWIIRHHIGNSNKVLDVGCGDGNFMKKVNHEKKYYAVGIDLFDAYLKKAKKTAVYKKVQKQDITKLSFSDKSFDCCLSSQVIEHISVTQGKKMIKKMETIAKSVVIIGTPNGHFHQETYDGNKLQIHHSSWNEKDFKEMGYHVYGQGAKFIYGEHGLIQKKFFNNIILKISLIFISYLFSPMVYIFPKYAAHLIAVKKV